jgi:hypothetical protein
MLPVVAQPYTEIIVGAGLGALATKLLVSRGKLTTGALLGGVIGMGLLLTKKQGFFPFSAGEFAGGWAHDRGFDLHHENRWGYGGFDPYAVRADYDHNYGQGFGHEQRQG